MINVIPMKVPAPEIVLSRLVKVPSDNVLVLLLLSVICPPPLSVDVVPKLSVALTPLPPARAIVPALLIGPFTRSVPVRLPPMVSVAVDATVRLPATFDVCVTFGVAPASMNTLSLMVGKLLRSQFVPTFHFPPATPIQCFVAMAFPLDLLDLQPTCF